MARRLNLNETKTCLRAWRELGDKNALSLLAECNQGLINYIAYRHFNKGLTPDELVSAGNEGLVRAINKFDYINKPIEMFSTYIATCIERQMLRDITINNKNANVISYDAPINGSDDDELKLESILGTDEEDLYNRVVLDIKSDIVREALKSLTYREQQIILLRYGLDEKHAKTLDEISKIFGCSKQNILLQEQRALTKMRHPRNTKKLKDFLDD